MNIMITGAAGQLGQELLQTAPSDVQVTAFGRNELDVTNNEAVQAAVKKVNPSIIINASAYTAVDRAEHESVLAHAVNGLGPEYLGKAALQHNARLLHVSTDFVFDGLKSSPYLPLDKTKPLNTYGESKVDGEARIQAIEGLNPLILRTSWVYSRFNNNFVKTMLRLMSERDVLNVVADQVGSPTWTGTLAQALWTMADKGTSGIHHWSDAGVCSWYDFAVAIYEEARQIGLLQSTVEIHPITTDEYPTPATRPTYSVMNKKSAWEATGITPLHWRDGLRQMLQQIKRQER